MKVLFVSHTFDNGVFKIGSHHLTRELARLGFDVAHISTPFSLIHSILIKNQVDRRRLALEGVRIDDSGVKHLIPRTVLPAQYNSGRYLLGAMTAVGMERPDYLFLDQPLMISAALLRSATVTIYRPTDLYLHGASHRLQSKYAHRFNAVAATSQQVLTNIPHAPGQPRIVIPNGVEYSRFAAADPKGSRKGAVYVGAFDSRFDWSTVIKMARAFPGERFSLVGPGAHPPAGLPANIEMRGPMSYQDVPLFLAGFAVGLLPLSADPLNAGRSPMKLFEYLASGLHVVATALPGLTTRTDLHGCFFHSTEAGAIEALSAAFAARSLNARGMKSARQQDWSAKAQQLFSFAESARAGGGQSPAQR